MAMKKAEKQTHRDRYAALIREAREAERAGLYRLGVEKALATWEHIDGMMQYARQFEKTEFDSVQGIDMILKYAPLLLDFPSLDKLEALLKENRRIDRNTSESLADKLAAARRAMWDNHRLWEHIERKPGTRQNALRQDLGGEQDVWRAVVEAWEKMGLVRRSPEGGSYRLSLSTRLGEVVRAKCPACGEVAEAPKGMFLEETRCPDCSASVRFVFMQPESLLKDKE